ncbi:hypothetical protein MRX96_011645 [Rhipicephalus microplus]
MQAPFPLRGSGVTTREPPTRSSRLDEAGGPAGNGAVDEDCRKPPAATQLPSSLERRNKEAIMARSYRRKAACKKRSDVAFGAQKRMASSPICRKAF